MALPSMECRKLFMDENFLLSSDSPSDEVSHQINPTNPVAMPEISTPKSQKRRISSPSKANESFEKTPEASFESPSSVLNPPSSLKRKTIRDYFLAAS